VTQTAALAAPSVSSEPPRSLGAIADAIAAHHESVERPSVRLGIVVIFGLYLIAALLSQGIADLSWLQELPFWVPPAIITASAAIVVAGLPILVLPPGVLDASITYAFVAMRGHAEWLRRYGAAFPDATAADAWIAEHAGEEYALGRAQVLVMNGRANEAVIPDEKHLADVDGRFLRAQLAFLRAFLAGDDGTAAREAGRAHELAAEHPAGDDRGVASATVALIDAYRVQARGGDWVRPLAAGRRHLGPMANRLVLRWLVWPRLRYFGRLSLVIFAIALLLNALAGGALDALRDAGGGRS
jgi:hypothetical protein